MVSEQGAFACVTFLFVNRGAESPTGSPHTAQLRDVRLPGAIT